MKRVLAAGFHELLANKQNTQGFKFLNTLFKNFLNDIYFKESEIQSMLTKNVSAIVQNYFSKLSIEKVVKKIVQRKQEKLFQYGRSFTGKNSNTDDSDESLSLRDSDTPN